MRRLIGLLSCVVLLAAGCGRGGGGNRSARLVVTGSSTIAPLAAAIARRFEERNPGTRIEVQMGGSSRGIRDARSGAADIGMVSRALGSAEREDLRAVTIARDGVAVILNAANPIESLSAAQVVSIYSGEVRNWRALGGADAPITVVNKAAGRATLAVFTAHFGVEPTRIRADVVIGDNEQGIKTVAGDANAIGYVSIGTARHDIEAGVPIRLLPADGVPATLASVGAGRYPVSRPLNLVTVGEPGALAARFLRFCRSPDVRDLVRSLRFAPVTTSEP